MRINDPIFSNLPQPKVKWHYGSLKISLEPTICLDKYVLNHITDVDPILHLFVQPHPDQMIQRIPVAIHKLVDCGVVACLCICNELFSLRRLGPHDYHRF
jgi:hypothetical protein